MNGEQAGFEPNRIIGNPFCFFVRRTIVLLRCAGIRNALHRVAACAGMTAHFAFVPPRRGVCIRQEMTTYDFNPDCLKMRHYLNE